MDVDAPALEDKTVIHHKVTKTIKNKTPFKKSRKTTFSRTFILNCCCLICVYLPACRQVRGFNKTGARNGAA